MDINLDIDAPRSDEYTREVASTVAEAVRTLNHHTFSAAGVPYPSTVYRVLGNLHAALSGLSQTLRQLSSHLARMEATGRVYDDRDRQDTELAARTIAAVREHLRAGRFADAEREAGHLGLLDEGEAR
ncbi:hypothetical protein [Nonomuraea endophytica]|uniref:hypothetical protein n=1 Tax=Nonomuraea endophytica TaxID=714136 RepID=UPI0037C53151